MDHFACQNAVRADELSWPPRSEGSFGAGCARRCDCHASAAHEEEMRVQGPSLDKRPPRRYEPLFTSLGEAVELCLSQDWERRVEFAVELVSAVNGAHDSSAAGNAATEWGRV